MAAIAPHDGPESPPPLWAASWQVDVTMKNARFPTGKRFSTLEDAVLELVRRYEGSFDRILFASEKEARRCAPPPLPLPAPPPRLRSAPHARDAPWPRQARKAVAVELSSRHSSQ